MLSIESRVLLNDGVRLPLLGLGTWLSGSHEGTETAVKHAIRCGYRLLDTATRYNNEAEVGRAIMDSGVKREDIFVTTKLRDHGYNTCISHFKASIAKLKTGYVDLYLMHHPLNGKILETYDAMTDLKDQGYIRSVGVSNFGIQHLEGLHKAGHAVPSVNQIEMHPYQYQAKLDIVEYCREVDIHVQGYCPLVKAQKMNDPLLVGIATKHKKTCAQVLIRWSIQMGFGTVPKSSILSYIDENADVFDFTLDESDLEKLNNITDTYSCSWDPTTAPWEG